MDSEYHRFILDSIQQKKAATRDEAPASAVAHDLALSFLGKYFEASQTSDKEEACLLFYREYSYFRDKFEKLLNQ